MVITGVLAHEMIHQETVENGNALTEKFECDMAGKIYDEHGLAFSSRMKEITSGFGLNIQKFGTSMSNYTEQSSVAVRDFAAGDYDDLKESDGDILYADRII